MGNKTKNILLTTLSIFNKMTVNYYYYRSDDEVLFCEGISSLEAGSKYLISKYIIDEIIVIGTKETIKDDDELDRVYICEENTWKQMDVHWQEYILGTRTISPFELYKYRIASFLRKNYIIDNEKIRDSALEVVSRGIDDIRKEEINQLIDNIIAGSNNIIAKVFIGEEKDFWQRLRTIISESIEHSFDKNNAYKKYIDEKEELEKYQLEYVNNDTLVGKYKELREMIARDEKLSFLEKEFLYISLNSRVNDSINRNKLLNKEAENIELRKENARLCYEINNLRTYRENREYEYAKYLIYQKLEVNERICPIEVKDISVRFISEQIENGNEDEMIVDNISGIIRALHGSHDEIINLYIDMQGGNRTSNYVRNAALSVLSNQYPSKVHIKEIVATNFNSITLGASEIVNETKRYGILDLVSGMNAFIQYGKADMLQLYCNKMCIEVNSPVGKLVQYMVKIDEAISLCDVNALTDTIKKLKVFFDSREVIERGYVENIFSVLQDGIKNDYGKLITELDGNEVNYLELISWCVKKGFIQQALTLIEDKMPTLYFAKGLLSYKFDEMVTESDRRDFWESLGPKYERRKENKLFYFLKNCCDENQTVELLWNISGNKNIYLKQNFYSEYEINKLEFIKTILGRIGKDKKCFINHDTLVKIKNEMDTCDNLYFAEQYCLFRRLENEFEKSEMLDLTCAETLCEYLGVERCKADDMFFSFLSCCGLKKYYFTKGKYKNKIWMEVNIHKKLNNYLKEVDMAFRLHEALKKERNCSNHASDRGIRIPINLVSRAIEIYVDIVTKLINEVK